jgi:hypothetical protein
LSVLAAAEVAQLSRQLHRMELHFSEEQASSSEASNRGSITIQNKSVNCSLTSTACQHGGNQYFVFANSHQTEPYLNWNPSDHQQDSEELNKQFDSIRDSKNFLHTEEALRNMLEFQGNTFGFEWHKGKGDEKYFRCSCKLCNLTTDRIYCNDYVTNVRIRTGGDRLNKAQHIFKAIFNVAPESLGST